MSKMGWRGAWSFSLVPAVLVALGGCAQDAPKEQAKAKTTATAAKADDSETWWCKEHGIPEEICARCDARVAAEFKKKGDWCQQHDRPESQCFICHPERKEKFAAQYRAKYGKEPPPMEDEKESKKKEKK
jgi:hypothetical protein